MKLSYIFNMLATGEINNLHLVDKETMSIKEDKKVAVLASINAALNDLHTRFILARDTVVIDNMVGEDTYTITADNFIELTSIYYNDMELTSKRDFVLLAPNKFKFISKLGILGELRVEYRARHKALTEVDIIMDAEVNLPDVYLNALLYFIASRLFTSAPNKMDGDLNEGTAYMRKFLEEVAMLERQGIDVDELNDSNGFYARGFV